MNPSTTVSVAKIFPYVNKERAQSYSDYDNFTVNWGSPDNYQLIKRVGKGKYSDVFLGVDIRSESDIIIKVLKPVRKRKIRREIKILENLRNHPNVIKLLDVVNSETNVPTLIFEYIACPDYLKLFSSISYEDIQFYMFELAKALYYAHSNGIMHRDVKPHNILVDFSRKILKLIDWGLAEFYHPGMNYNVRVASRYYKSPELLVDYQYYDYSLDVWSYGCVLGGLIFQKEPLFHGSDNKDQLIKILNVLGTSELKKYLAKYNHFIPKDLSPLIEDYNGFLFETLIDKNNSHLASPSVVTLLKKCLSFDHMDRPTAEQILSDNFFKISERSILDQNS